MTGAVVFAGVTIDVAGRAGPDCVELRPPVGRGDVVRLVEQCSPRAVGIIDGVFESAPAMMHKEILWAMSRGVHVFGGAGYGSLRAVELAPYGMVGVGEVYRCFRDGTLQDDDEVAVAVRRTGDRWQRLSEAMVNIRATLRLAENEAVICARAGHRLEAFAKSLFYKERSFDRILAWASAQAADDVDVERLRRWIMQNAVEPMKEDAEGLLRHLEDFLDNDPPPLEIGYEIAPARCWLDALSAARGRVAD